MKKFLFIALGMAALFSQLASPGLKRWLIMASYRKAILLVLRISASRFVRSRQERWAAWSAISSATEKARRQ